MDHSSPPQLSVLAPRLLQGVASRAPLKLEAFLAMADGNNPTLRQAAAMIRRSEAEARQAALYPNPTVGYEGDQIRGGSYGGENRVALSPKPSCWAASSAFAATSTSSKSSPIQLLAKPSSCACTTM